MRSNLTIDAPKFVELAARSAVGAPGQRALPLWGPCSDAGEMLIAFCWPPLLCQGWGVMLRWSGGWAGPNCVLGAMYVNLLPGPL